LPLFQFFKICLECSLFISNFLDFGVKQFVPKSVESSCSKTTSKVFQQDYLQDYLNSKEPHIALVAAFVGAASVLGLQGRGWLLLIYHS
jgi:hypothetical protein